MPSTTPMTISPSGPTTTWSRRSAHPGEADDELTEEQRFLAAYRETAGAAAGPSGPSTTGRKPTSISARRLGAGGTAVVVAVALSGGVAAAYTGNLPDPVPAASPTP